MNATNLGKILVYFHVVFSLVLMALAVGIVTNSIDWAGGGGPGETPGEHARKQEAIKTMQGSLLVFRSQWKEQHDILLALDKKRPEDQKWYAEQLKIAETGTNFARQRVPNAVKILEYEPNGKIKAEKDPHDLGRPILADHPDKRFIDLKKLTDEIAIKDEEIKQAIEEIQKLIQEQQQLTFTLQGVPGKIKGLYALLEEAKTAQENSKKALDYARQESINGRVASQSLLRRGQELALRISELRKKLAALGEVANP